MVSFLPHYLNSFRKEPAITKFGQPFTPYHNSSETYATGTGSIFHSSFNEFQSGHDKLTWFRVCQMGFLQHFHIVFSTVLPVVSFRFRLCLHLFRLKQPLSTQVVDPLYNKYAVISTSRNYNCLQAARFHPVSETLFLPLSPSSFHLISILVSIHPPNTFPFRHRTRSLSVIMFFTAQRTVPLSSNKISRVSFYSMYASVYIYTGLFHRLWFSYEILNILLKLAVSDFVRHYFRFLG